MKRCPHGLPLADNVCGPCSKGKPNRSRGRPSLTGETGQRYQVTIPPTIADKIRAAGGGSLSRGIIALAKRK